MTSFVCFACDVFNVRSWMCFAWCFTFQDRLFHVDSSLGIIAIDSFNFRLSYISSTIFIGVLAVVVVVVVVRQTIVSISFICLFSFPFVGTVEMKAQIWNTHHGGGVPIMEGAFHYCNEVKEYVLRRHNQTQS